MPGSMYTLYVGRDKAHRDRHDPGSELCLRIVPRLTDVEVVECSGRRDAPRGIRGTPSLVHDESGDVFTGCDAAVLLLELAAAVPAKASATAPPATRTMAPQMQLRPDTPRAAPVESTGVAPPGTFPNASAPDLADLWTATVGPTDGEVDDEPRRLTQDDLSAAMRARDAT